MMNDEAWTGDEEEAPSSWRSIGAVALGWTARVEAVRDEAAEREELRRRAMAWAAE